MRNLFYIIILLLLPTHLFSQSSIIRTYTTLDGLPSLTLYSCIQDENGNMWFASESGLIEYNGRSWSRLDSVKNENLNYSFSSVLKDEQGTIWAFPGFNLTDKVFYKKDNSWESITIESTNYKNSIIIDISIFDNQPHFLSLSQQRSVVFGTNEKMENLSIDGSTGIKVYDGRFIDTQIFLGTNRGLIIYNPETKIYDTGFIDKTGEIIAISKQVNTDEIYLLGLNWIGQFIDNKIIILKENFEIPFYEQHTNYAFINVTPFNDFYFGTIFGSYRWNQLIDHTEKLDNSMGFSSSGATSCFVDYESNVWITSLRGLTKVKHSPFINLYESDGLSENEITAIESFPNGPIILAHNGSFSALDENKVIRLSLPSQKEHRRFHRILYLTYDPKLDVVWFNSQLLGIGYITRQLKVRWQNNILSDGSFSFLSLFIDNRGNIYYSTDKYLYRIDNGNPTPLKSISSLNVRRISRYDDENLILATKKGLYLFNEYTSEIDSFKTGTLLADEVYSFYKMTNNKWLVGTYNGLYIFDGKKLSKFDDLAIDKPVFFIDREEEFLWFGLMGGALRWNPSTGQQFLFTPTEGLAGVETNRDAFLYQDGKVFIGTAKGLSVFHSQLYNEELYQSKPKLNFYGLFNLKGIPYKIEDEIHIPYSKPEVLLRYNSPSFIDENLVDYTIVLVNLSKETREIYRTSSDNYLLRNLDSGTYELKISATNAKGVSSDTLSLSTIVIKTPFFKNYWFYFFVIIFLISVSYSVYEYLAKNRYSKLLEIEVKKRTKELRNSERNIRDLTQRIFTTQEEEREKIARELHDNFSQELALVKFQLDKLSNEIPTDDSSKFSWLSNKLNDILISLKNMAFLLHPNSIKQMGIINAIQALCKDVSTYSNIEIEFFSNIDEPLNMNEEYQTNIYRFVQEGLTNIRKHSKAESGIVIFILKNDFFNIRIEDDGIGFNYQKYKPNKTKYGMGLASMEERIRLLGGELNIKSFEGEGCKLNAKIPISILNQPDSFANSSQASGS